MSETPNLEKKCTKCNQLKPINDFSVDREKSDGYCSHCKICHRKRSSNPNRILASVKSRAKRNGIPFNLTIEDIVIPEYCPVLGIKLENGIGKQCNNSPSLDRIDNNKGYIKGNVAIISSKANSVKRDLSVEEVESLLEYMRR